MAVVTSMVFFNAYCQVLVIVPILTACQASVRSYPIALVSTRAAIISDGEQALQSYLSIKRG